MRFSISGEIDAAAGDAEHITNELARIWQVC